LYYTASGIIAPVGGRPVHQCTGRPPIVCDDARYCIIQFNLLMMSTRVLETCRGIKLTYYKTRICALIWSIAKIVVRWTVRKTSKIKRQLNQSACAPLCGRLDVLKFRFSLYAMKGRILNTALTTCFIGVKWMCFIT